MKNIYKAFLVTAGFWLLLLAGCTVDRMTLDLDGGTDILSLVLDDELEGVIDAGERTATVRISTNYDASAMTLTELKLSEGAEADVKQGEILNMEYPQTIRVVNGNAYQDWLLTAKRDVARLLTVKLGMKYEGIIEGNTVRVFVPEGEDVTALALNYETEDNGTADIANGAACDFSSPLTLTVTNRTAVRTYTISVVLHNMSMEPKAFIGYTDDISKLGDETRAAAEWALANIPNMTYVNVNDVMAGTARLADYKMIWCHFDFTDWPGYMWDSRDKFNSFWATGGRILATRDGARYINDVWCIALDQKDPNMQVSGPSTTLTDAKGFSCKGSEEHELFDGLDITSAGMVYLKSSGCSVSGRMMQWKIADGDTPRYIDIADWRTKTGATELANDENADENVITIAEFEPRKVVNNMSGAVIVIGTPYYEWYDKSGTTNLYEGNIHQLTKNAINNLCK